EPEPEPEIEETWEEEATPSFQAPAQPEAKPAPQFSIATTDEEPPTWGNDTGKLTIATDPVQARELFASDSATGAPIEIPQAPNAMPGGNVVRFEIFLSPEQL